MTCDRTHKYDDKNRSCIQQTIDFARQFRIGSVMDELLGAGWVSYKVHYTAQPIPPKTIKLNHTPYPFRRQRTPRKQLKPGAL